MIFSKHIQRNPFGSRAALMVSLVTIVFLQASCSLVRFSEPHIAAPSSPVPAGELRRIAIFLDGTYNDENSGTNVRKLFDRTSNSNQAHSFYIEGVGAKGKPLGMALAWGNGYRVRKAYEYLLMTYRPGDEIYIFGFSRGAYSARILASLLQHAGLPRQPLSVSEKQLAKDLADEIYDAFKCSGWKFDNDCARLQRSDRVAAIQEAQQRVSVTLQPRVPVHFLGLWDTVEALGWPDYEEDVDVPNSRYADQLCNVRVARHAVALDDNRARIFTPILMTRKHLIDQCDGEDAPAAGWKAAINEKVKEVWFAGAHADVGGGYEEESGGLSGVSLKWMIDEASNAGLPVDGEGLEQAPLAMTHDAEAALPTRPFYRRRYRDVDAYAADERSSSPTLLLHACLIEHIKLRPRGPAEYGGSDPLAQALLSGVRERGSMGFFEACFERGPDSGFVFKENSDACKARVRVEGAC